jgi:hypothetical protein
LSQLQQRPVTKSAADTFQSLLLRLIVSANLPFAFIANPHFREYSAFLNSELTANLLPKSGKTVRKWLKKEYRHRRSILKQELANALSKIHSSFDLWTSPAMEAFLSLVVYFVNQAGKRQVRLLGLHRIFGIHSGENQASVMLQIYQDYNICAPESLGFFVADNADNCDSCVRATLASLYPNHTTNERLALQQVYRRRCFGHILHLIARAFFEGTSKDLFDQFETEQETEELTRRWRQHGPVGKIHNVVAWIRRTPKRKDAFTKLTNGEEAGIVGEPLLFDNLKGTGLVKDNQTRWNSTLLMILRALKLRAVIDHYCSVSRMARGADKRIPSEDILGED